MPTEKAYGVTILETAKASKTLGIQAEIWCTSNLKNNFENEIIKPKYKEFRKYTLKFLEFFSFQLNRFCFLNECISQFQDEDIIVWTRDVLGMMLILRKTTQVRIALELHNPLGAIDNWVVKTYSRSIRNSGSRVRVFTLSEALKDRLQPELKEKFGGLIHMASPDEFFNAKPKLTEDSSITIGYIGKAESSGKNNNLDEVLKRFIIELENFENLKLSFIGIEDHMKAALSSLVPKYLLDNHRVKIVGHVSRADVFNYLVDIDIGLVPYISNEYNDYRFPIKIVEYGSMHCALLFNDSQNLRNLIGSNGVSYTHNSQETIHSALSRFIGEPEYLNFYKSSAFEWAKNYTYSKRVEVVLNSF